MRRSKKTRGQQTLISVPATESTAKLTSGSSMSPAIIEKCRLRIEQRRAQRAEEWRIEQQAQDELRLQDRTCFPEEV